MLTNPLAKKQDTVQYYVYLNVYRASIERVEQLSFCTSTPSHIVSLAFQWFAVGSCLQLR